MASLITKQCVPCDEQTPLLDEGTLETYLKELDSDWELQEGKKLTRTFTFNAFREAISFVNQVATLAEQENHHPDIHIRYRTVTLELSTYTIKGLSENDFIVAAKIDLISGWQMKLEHYVLSRVFSVRVVLIAFGILFLIYLWQYFF